MNTNKCCHTLFSRKGRKDIEFALNYRTTLVLLNFYGIHPFSFHFSSVSVPISVPILITVPVPNAVPVLITVPNPITVPVLPTVPVLIPFPFLLAFQF